MQSFRIAGIRTSVLYPWRWPPPQPASSCERRFSLFCMLLPSPAPGEKRGTYHHFKCTVPCCSWLLGTSDSHSLVQLVRSGSNRLTASTHPLRERPLPLRATVILLHGRPEHIFMSIGGPTAHKNRLSENRKRPRLRHDCVVPTLGSSTTAEGAKMRRRTFLEAAAGMMTLAGTSHAAPPGHPSPFTAISSG